jgi:2,4-didehydro-3-deoxy-L-rhamnonate hydrolase
VRPVDPAHFLKGTQKMKLVRFGARGSEKPGVIDARGVVRDLSGAVPDIDARTLSPAALARLREIDHI